MAICSTDAGSPAEIGDFPQHKKIESGVSLRGSAVKSLMV